MSVAPTTQYLSSKWDVFSICLPANADAVQRYETRQAFFAGLSAMYELLVMETPDDEREAMKMMADLDIELHAFVDELVGRAVDGLSEVDKEIAKRRIKETSATLQEVMREYQKQE